MKRQEFFFQAVPNTVPFATLPSRLFSLQVLSQPIRIPVYPLQGPLFPPQKGGGKGRSLKELNS